LASCFSPVMKSGGSSTLQAVSQTQSASTRRSKEHRPAAKIRSTHERLDPHAYGQLTGIGHFEDLLREEADTLAAVPCCRAAPAPDSAMPFNHQRSYRSPELLLLPYDATEGRSALTASAPLGMATTWYGLARVAGGRALMITSAGQKACSPDRGDCRPRCPPRHPSVSFSGDG
jgi:hypothetical protein